MATVLGIFFIIVCVLMVLVVLLQKGRGGGLGAALGGLGSSAFGTKTGDMATVVTIILAFLFLTIAVGATYVFRPNEVQLPPPVVLVAGQAVRDSVQVAPDTPIQPRTQFRGVTIRHAWDDREVTEDSPVVPPEGLLAKFEPQQEQRILHVRSYREGFPTSETVTVVLRKQREPAPSPRIDPGSMAIETALEVTIVPNVNGDREVTTRYTLDGEEPTVDSPLYTAAFMVQPDTTVKARNYVEGFDPSAVVTAEYPAKAPETPETGGGGDEGEPGESPDGQ
jgi:preprotein translocase subunit SecG